MDWPYELQIGWRYTRAGRSGRRNRFISFISAASMAGIALGVAALIIVLSVMNGFRKEVRDRMLSVVSHVEVGMARGEALADWRATAERVRRHPEVEAIAPFVAAEYFDAAEACFTNARTLAPDDMRWPYYLGHVFRLKSDTARA
jgi:lipoprotein-releasing system permease protein